MGLAALVQLAGLGGGRRPGYAPLPLSTPVDRAESSPASVPGHHQGQPGPQPAQQRGSDHGHRGSASHGQGISQTAAAPPQPHTVMYSDPAQQSGQRGVARHSTEGASNPKRALAPSPRSDAAHPEHGRHPSVPPCATPDLSRVRPPRTHPGVDVGPALDEVLEGGRVSVPGSQMHAHETCGHRGMQHISISHGAAFVSLPSFSRGRLMARLPPPPAGLSHAMGLTSFCGRAAAHPAPTFHTSGGAVHIANQRSLRRPGTPRSSRRARLCRDPPNRAPRAL